ncbi:MAG: hypothetical protein RLZZ15_477 [Verrucomicrobiota bacterium]|jgi:predicted nucleic acid-binding protein
MKFVVHDASILIDLALSKTVEAWFATGAETWTTNLIFPAEIVKPEQRALFSAYAEAKKLQIKELTPSEIEDLVRTRTRLSMGLSLADVSALSLTKSLGTDAVLATGDRLLRTTADREKVKACGILTLFDVMVEGTKDHPGVLPPSVAVEKLRSLMRLPECRLPADRCEEKIKGWGKKS